MPTPTSTEAHQQPSESGQNPYLRLNSLPSSTTPDSPTETGVKKKRGFAKLFPSTRRKNPAGPAAPGTQHGKRKTGADGSQADNAFKAAPRSTRDILGYKTMLRSGVAWLGADEWSLTMHIDDINYVSAATDHQEGILDRWARFINSFGAGVRLQLSVINRVLDDADVAALVQQQLTGDHYDSYRADFNRIVREKLAEAAGNTVTDKYLTITVQEFSTARYGGLQGPTAQPSAAATGDRTTDPPT
jgi:hypothetical protein